MNARLMRKRGTRGLVGMANRGGSIGAPAQGSVSSYSSPAEKEPLAAYVSLGETHGHDGDFRARFFLLDFIERPRSTAPPTFAGPSTTPRPTLPPFGRHPPHSRGMARRPRRGRGGVRLGVQWIEANIFEIYSPAGGSIVALAHGRAGSLILVARRKGTAGSRSPHPLDARPVSGAR